MKLKMKKLVSLGLVSAMSLTMLAGCGNSNGATNDTGSSKNQESKAAGDVKIGVLVQDVSGEEALGFRAYYEDYVADQYGVTFTYTDELKDAASEKSAIGFFLAALCMSMLNSTFAVFSNEVNASMQAIINAVLLVVFLIYLSNEQLLVKIFTGKRKA